MPNKPKQLKPPKKMVRRFPIGSSGKLYYGPWPDVAMLRVLKEHDVDTIWNLAEELKLLIPYEKYFVPNIIHGDIQDYYPPENMTKFAAQLRKIADLLKAGKNIFVHCFGGHGRTGMALAAIDLMVSDSSPKVALQKAYQATGGPESDEQVDFVEDLSYYLQGKPIPKRKKQKFHSFLEGTGYGGRRGSFKQDPKTNRWVWVEEFMPQEPDPFDPSSWGQKDIDWGEPEPMNKGQWPSEKPIRDPYSKEIYDVPSATKKPGQTLSFMEWWGQHPEFKDYDAAKTYWAKEQKALRKAIRKEKVQPEFCPYCGAHLMYPRDHDHIANHLKNLNKPKK